MPETVIEALEVIHIQHGNRIATPQLRQHIVQPTPSGQAGETVTIGQDKHRLQDADQHHQNRCAGNNRHGKIIQTAGHGRQGHHKTGT